MDMATILFNDAEQFEQINNTPSTDGPVWNHGTTNQAISDKQTY